MRPASLHTLAACVCAIVVCHEWVTTEAEPRTLTRAAIEEAIAFGARGEPSPYLLRHVGDSRSPIVVGAVYTPFLRVALLSWATAGRGERLDPDSLDAALTEPLAYIAFRWYCCDSPATSSAFSTQEPQAVMLPTSPTATLPPENAVGHGLFRGTRPVWSQSGTKALEEFGAAPTHDDVAVVAAFPLDRLRAGQRFAVYKDMGTTASVRIGVVRDADLARWR